MYNLFSLVRTVDNEKHYEQYEDPKRDHFDQF